MPSEFRATLSTFQVPNRTNRPSENNHSRQLFFPSSISFTRTNQPRILGYFSFPLLVSALLGSFLILQFASSVPALLFLREHVSHARFASFSCRCLFQLCKGLFRLCSLLLQCRICFCYGRYAPILSPAQ